MVKYEIQGFSHVPTIVISDVHASLHWRGIISERKAGDRLIFLGDYFLHRGYGPFAQSEAQNFLDICEYTRSFPDTHMLIGNHDFDYTPFPGWPLWDKNERENRKAIMDNIDLLNMVFVDNSEEKGLIFSHGGVTQTFMDLNKLKTPEELNLLWRSSPEKFRFVERDPKSGVYSEIHGDDPWQSPIWARTMAITEDGIAGFNQVVGHTVVRVPEIYTTIHGDKFIMTCTLDDAYVYL